MFVIQLQFWNNNNVVLCELPLYFHRDFAQGIEIEPFELGILELQSSIAETTDAVAASNWRKL